MNKEIFIIYVILNLHTMLVFSATKILDYFNIKQSFKNVCLFIITLVIFSYYLSYFIYNVTL